MSPRYMLERWPLGWLLCATEPGSNGVPVDALSECMPLFKKNAVMDSGIVHHLRETGRRDVIVCIATERDSREWRAEIDKSLASLNPQERWWKGLDVGLSSAAIFAVFCDMRWRDMAKDMGHASVPHDGDDFGRCKRLIDMFPQWRSELYRVADEYPDTMWPKIIARWDELEKATPEQQYKILNEL